MKNLLNSISERVASLAVVILMTGVTTSALSAKEWQAWMGAQSRDLGSQAIAYLPSELWVHTNDTVRWTLSSTEIHTVTFLKPGQVRPPLFGPVFEVPVGCPGNTPDGASFDGSDCVNSGVMGSFGKIAGPQSYTVKFPVAGNFKLQCLVHFDMTGSVHVLNSSDAAPYDQTFYDTQAFGEAATLLSEAAHLTNRGNSENIK